MGGQTRAPHDALDVVETFDSNLGSWTISRGSLPRRMFALRAANIDGRVLIFGEYIFMHIIHHIKETYNLRWPPLPWF